MSSAVIFLVGALVACSVGLVLLWVVHMISQRRRRRVVPFSEQMRALSLDPNRPRHEQPVGIVTLDPIDEES